MNELVKSLILRFVRAFVAGAVGNMVVIMSFNGNSWNDIKIWLSALAMSGIVGGLSGLLMMLDKWVRSENQ